MDAVESARQVESTIGEPEIIKPSRSQRKPVKATRDMVAPTASIEPFSVDDLVLTTDTNNSFYFWRFKYKGCPQVGKPRKEYRGKKDPKLDYIDIGRDDLIRELFNIFKTDFNSSKKTYAENLMAYIGWLDSEGLKPVEGNYFHNNLISKYFKYVALQVKTGKWKKGTWSSKRASFGFLLKAMGRGTCAENIPSPKDHRSDIKPFKTLDIETELKPTAQALFRAYYCLLKHFDGGTKPKVHPLWDEERFNQHNSKIDISAHGIAARRLSFTQPFKTSDHSEDSYWVNTMTRIAIMITYMLTGMNRTPLERMCHHDAKFKQAKKGSYVFDATKNRAKYLRLDSGVGLNVSAKRFIESWLNVSVRIQQDERFKNGGDGLLFPFITSELCITGFHFQGYGPQQGINSRLEHLGLTPVNASVLRKTKANGLMRVTGDLYKVSVSANNKVTTIAKAYAHGTEKDHERSWAAAGQALYNYAKKGDIDSAVNQAKFDYNDPLTEYDYQKRLRPKNEALTPSGVRCQNNKKGSSKLIAEAIKKSGSDVPQAEIICTDFLGCFKCEHHKLVAAVDDIWLMLSFRDTLEDMLQYPSVNSLPKSRHHKLCVTIDSILARFKELDEGNFKQAQELHEEGSHPLYSSLFSLNDLLEIFS
jgi:hypothetical protein